MKKIPKAVMMSIKPKWCDLIIRGEKTFELRKSRPSLKAQLNLPMDIKVYIYCTKSTKSVSTVYEKRVIGYFTCSRFWHISTPVSNFDKIFLLKSCLTVEEVKKYLKGKGGWSWSIGDLVIFKYPKLLEDYGLKKPPMSWCYIYYDEK